MSDEARDELLRRQKDRREQRGRLLARVDVYVWENGDATPQVTLPPEAALSVEDHDRIAEVVRMARQALADWR